MEENIELASAVISLSTEELEELKNLLEDEYKNLLNKQINLSAKIKNGPYMGATLVWRLASIPKGCELLLKLGDKLPVDRIDWNAIPISGEHVGITLFWWLAGANDNGIKLLLKLCDKLPVDKIDWNATPISGEYIGITPFWLLVSSAEGRQLLLKLGDKLPVDKIDWNALPSSEEFPSETAFLWLTSFSEGRQLLLKLGDKLPVDKIDWNAAPISEANLSLTPVGHLASTSTGRELLLKLCDKLPIDKIDWNAAPRSGGTVFWWLACSDSGREFLLRISDRLPIDKINWNAAPYSGREAEQTAFWCLAYTPEGRELLLKLSDKLPIDKIDWNVIQYFGPWAGKTIFFNLASSTECRAFLFELHGRNSKIFRNVAWDTKSTSDPHKGKTIIQLYPALKNLMPSLESEEQKTNDVEAKLNELGNPCGWRVKEFSETQNNKKREWSFQLICSEKTNQEHLEAAIRFLRSKYVSLKTKPSFDKKKSNPLIYEVRLAENQFNTFCSFIENDLRKYLQESLMENKKEEEREIVKSSTDKTSYFDETHQKDIAGKLTKIKFGAVFEEAGNEYTLNYREIWDEKQNIYKLTYRGLEDKELYTVAVSEKFITDQIQRRLEKIGFDVEWGKDSHTLRIKSQTLEAIDYGRLNKLVEKLIHQLEKLSPQKHVSVKTEDSSVETKKTPENKVSEEVIEEDESLPRKFFSKLLGVADQRLFFIKAIIVKKYNYIVEIDISSAKYINISGNLIAVENLVDHIGKIFNKMDSKEVILVKSENEFKFVLAKPFLHHFLSGNDEGTKSACDEIRRYSGENRIQTSVEHEGQFLPRKLKESIAESKVSNTHASWLQEILLYKPTDSLVAKAIDYHFAMLDRVKSFTERLDKEIVSRVYGFHLTGMFHLFYQASLKDRDWWSEDARNYIGSIRNALRHKVDASEWDEIAKAGEYLIELKKLFDLLPTGVAKINLEGAVKDQYESTQMFFEDLSRCIQREDKTSPEPFDMFEKMLANYRSRNRKKLSKEIKACEREALMFAAAAIWTSKKFKGKSKVFLEACQQISISIGHSYEKSESDQYFIEENVTNLWDKLIASVDQINTFKQTDYPSAEMMSTLGFLNQQADAPVIQHSGGLKPSI